MNKVFYSFHFDNDVMRVQLIRQMGVVEGNEPVLKNVWEEVKGRGDAAVEKWIDDNMKYRSCVIVLIGEKTSGQRWVKYEIKKAWEDKKGLFGIYIHNLRDARRSKIPPCFGKCSQGQNPFEQFTFSYGSKLSDVIKCYDPNPDDAYNDIANNIEKWVENAIEMRK